MCKKTHRTSAQWIAELRGNLGPFPQHEAHYDLSAYLYVVLSNQLTTRRSSLPRIATLHSQEINCLIEDFLQSFMLKMTQNDYALLDKFSGTGRFLAWAAQVSINMMMSEMRKVEWRNQSLSSEKIYVDSETVMPEIEAMRSDLAEGIDESLAHLPERYQQALRRCIMNGDCAKDVAEDLGISQNAVNILVYRAKKAMRKQLKRRGIGPEALTVFA
ncbi:MAG: sigma-70 family RNA polymerase sigma factor [Chloroflexota bacterium]